MLTTSRLLVAPLPNPPPQGGRESKGPPPQRKEPEVSISLVNGCSGFMGSLAGDELVGVEQRAGRGGPGGRGRGREVGGKLRGGNIASRGGVCREAGRLAFH